MFKRLISLTIIFSLFSIDLVRAMEPDDKERTSLPVHRVQKQQLLQRQQEIKEEEYKWQRTLETLKTQKTDLDRRQEALTREEAKVRENLDKVALQQQYLLQEKQKLEEEGRRWQEKREQEETKLKQEDEDYQRRVDEARRKQVEEDRIHSQEVARKNEEFQAEQLKLLEDQRSAQEAIQSKEGAQEALKRVLEEQRQLQQEQKRAESEERQWQAQRREKERQLAEEATARLYRLSEARRTREEEDTRFKQTLEGQKEALQRQEQTLRETELRAQEEGRNLSLRQEVLERERGKWAEDTRNAQSKLDACLREQEETSSVLSSSPPSTFSSGGSRTTSSPSSSPEKESLLDKRPKKKNDERTPLLKAQGSIQGDTSLKDFADFVFVDFEKGEGNDQRDLEAIVQKVRDLDPEDPVDRGVLAFLSYAKEHINDGKFTWRQILLGGIGGTLIGVGVGNAMPAILSNGLDSILGKEVYWNSIGADLFTAHTAITLGIDSISRNIMILGNTAKPSTKEFSISGKIFKFGKLDMESNTGVFFLIYVGAGFSALLPVYYLWSVEEKDISFDPGLKTASLTYFGCLAPTLFLDALFANARAMQDWVDEKINARLVRRAFGEELSLSPTGILRQQELKRFDDVIRILRATSDNDIHDLYEQVLGNELNNGVDKPEEILKGVDTIQTLKALRKIHATYEIPAENEKKWKHKVAKVLGWGIPILATVARTLVFYAIIHELLGDLGENGITNKIISGVFGGGIASLFLGKVEVEAVEEGVYQLLHGKDIESDASKSRLWKGLRKIGKTYNFAQGVWNTLPYILVGIQATNGWPVAVQVAMLLFFGIADAFNNTMAFHESYGGVVNGAESLVSYKYATAGYKRNKLIKMVRHYKKAYETMTPDIIMKLDFLISNEG